MDNSCMVDIRPVLFTRYNEVDARPGRSEETNLLCLRTILRLNAVCVCECVCVCVNVLLQCNHV
eukprot:COSAG02_NODE_4614_length_5165_cov_1.697592_4_plen_64_part_00